MELPDKSSKNLEKDLKNVIKQKNMNMLKELNLELYGQFGSNILKESISAL